MTEQIYKYKKEDRIGTEYWEDEIVVEVINVIKDDSKKDKELYIKLSNYYEDVMDDMLPEDKECEIYLPKEEAIKMAKAILKAFEEK